MAEDSRSEVTSSSEAPRVISILNQRFNVINVCSSSPDACDFLRTRNQHEALIHHVDYDAFFSCFPTKLF